jgi:glutamate---cysteine ligase / carboxylate-amine ligase
MGTVGARTVGVEEELLLVDMATGRPRSVAGRVIDAAASSRPADAGSEGGVEGELQRYMVEMQSSVCTDLADVERELQGWRHRVAVAAREAGAGSAALGTAPLSGDGLITPKPRYLRMVERFGPVVHDVLTCGSHVHVSVESDDEGVAVLDRIRVWLPIVLALSANSPFSNGKDTGYASYRSQLWLRWPSAGPSDLFGSASAYHSVVRSMVESGVLLDDGMVYFDARLSHQYPTVEIRSADVCADLDDTMVVAAICRGLVETASRAAAAGEPPLPLPSSLVRLATWQAAHDGVDGVLVDPTTMRPKPAAVVVGRLVDAIRPALVSFGDMERVERGVARLLTNGSGATRQRRTFARTGRLVDVVAEAVRLSAGA